jgi:hypothetical protein
MTTLPVEHLFTLTCTTAPAIRVPDGPAGTRLLYAVTGGSFEGARLRGTVVTSPGGDWATLGADGVLRLDVRLVLRPEDSDPIIFSYRGVSARDADGVASIRIAGQFEAGPGPEAWLNGIQVVGVGRVSERAVTYELYQLL